MPCAHVIFDTEPTPRGKSDPASVDEMSLGMIRFVVYFYLPLFKFFMISPSTGVTAPANRPCQMSGISNIDN